MSIVDHPEGHSQDDDPTVAGPAINDRTAFAGFLTALADSHRDRPLDWENHDLERFLRAWSSWLDSMDNYYAWKGEPVPDAPSWNVLADMLRAARVYE